MSKPTAEEIRAARLAATEADLARDNAFEVYRDCTNRNAPMCDQARAWQAWMHASGRAARAHDHVLALVLHSRNFDDLDAMVRARKSVKRILRVNFAVSERRRNPGDPTKTTTYIEMARAMYLESDEHYRRVIERVGAYRVAGMVLTRLGSYDAATFAVAVTAIDKNFAAITAAA